MSLKTCIKNVFKIAKLLSTEDSGALRFGVSAMLGKSQKTMLFSPYGLMHHPPSNSMVLLWSQQGQESNGIGMADDPNNRTLKGLAEGEVALGNYLTGHHILFDENGLCTLVTDDLKILAASSVVVESPSVEITSPTVNITGASLTHNGVNIGHTHIHSQANDSDGDAEQDTGYPHS